VPGRFAGSFSHLPCIDGLSSPCVAAFRDHGRKVMGNPGAQPLALRVSGARGLRHRSFGARDPDSPLFMRSPLSTGPRGGVAQHPDGPILRPQRKPASGCCPRRPDPRHACRPATCGRQAGARSSRPLHRSCRPGSSCGAISSAGDTPGLPSPTGVDREALWPQGGVRDRSRPGMR
jgi:hypothetical protein